MTAKILPFPSRCTPINRRVKYIGRNGLACELPEPRHVSRTRATSAGLPVVPDLPYCSDPRGRGIKRQVLRFAPRTKWMLGFFLGHRSCSKLFAYGLTIARKRLSGSIMSANVLQFRRMDQVPNRIRELRNAVGWSQQALGDAVGCSKMTISDLERGGMELTLEYMRRIGRALGVSPADILLPDDNPDRISDEERDLLLQFREAAPNQRELIRRVAEPVSGRSDRRAA